jgi:hypothetical protein
MTNSTNKIEASITHKIIDCVMGCISENKGKTLELMDGSIVRLTPSLASKFVEIHDQLNESSQASFRLMLVESKKTFEGINAFCKERN